MTEPAQLRLNIDPDLRNEFKAACMRSGTCMADQAARMIAQFVDGSESGNASDANPADEAVSALPVVFSGDPTPGANSLADLFAPEQEALAAATQDDISWLYDQQGKDANRRVDLLANSINTVGDKVAAQVARSHADWQSALIVRRRDRYWLGCAASGGVSALCVVLALISGTGAGRNLAVRLAGGESPWHAALLIAGDGHSADASLMMATETLLEKRPFRTQLTNCVDRAKQSKIATRCTLVMPALPPAT
jgi:hypothetical protein